jgi:hypothetical protein
VRACVEPVVQMRSRRLNRFRPCDADCVEAFLSRALSETDLQRCKI